MTWDCGIGTEEEDHEWEYISGWYGDPGVINGTCDIRYKRCKVCGKEEPWDGSRADSYEEDYRREP